MWTCFIRSTMINRVNWWGIELEPGKSFSVVPFCIPTWTKPSDHRQRSKPSSNMEVKQRPKAATWVNGLHLLSDHTVNYLQRNVRTSVSLTDGNQTWRRFKFNNSRTTNACSGDELFPGWQWNKLTFITFCSHSDLQYFSTPLLLCDQMCKIKAQLCPHYTNKMWNLCSDPWSHAVIHADHDKLYFWQY